MSDSVRDTHSETGRGCSALQTGFLTPGSITVGAT